MSLATPSSPVDPAGQNALRELLRVWGVEASYTDTTGRRRTPPLESRLAVLRLLGAPIERPEDAPAALTEWKLDRWRRLLPPVVVVPHRQTARVVVRLRANPLPSRIACRTELDNGEELQQRFRVTALEEAERIRLAGESFVAVELDLGGSLPTGYHRLELEAGSKRAVARLIVAPGRAHALRRGERGWGAFVPLHALHGERSWGAGSYSDLSRLGEWTAERGGDTVSTLPLLDTYLDRPFDPSPYMPVSRRMWNELHIDVETAVATLGDARPAEARLSSAARRRLARLRAAHEVDHRAQLRLQRTVLEPLARAFFAGRASRRTAFRRFVRGRPEVEDYARFRAATDRLGNSWPEWPDRLRSGRLEPGDYDSDTARYYAFAQWLATEQLASAARTAETRGVRICLDVPLGVHPQGYDVWRERELFATGASAGAPPDDFFTGGQNWCFPPLRPGRSHEEGHRYFRACLRHQMRAAGMLRFDHVMSLHRLFWIPDGFEPQDGSYVRYPAEELYATLCLESERNRSVVVGEDLGTVQREVRTTMRRRGLLRTLVLQFGGGTDSRRPLESMRIEGVASLHTHDMPTFAAFWRGLDVARRVRLGHLPRDAAARERKARARLRAAWIRDLRRGGWLDRKREVTTADALRACLAFLADSKATTVLVDLEDLWGETVPQNVPGTTTEHPNWRRRGRHSLETLATMPRVESVLASLRNRSDRGRG